MSKKPINFKELCAKPPLGIKLEIEMVTVAEALHFMKLACMRLPENTQKPKDTEGSTVLDELKARLGMVHATILTSEQQALYKVMCICPRYHPCCELRQHMDQIISDRNMLSREGHIFSYATPKKNPLSLRPLKQPIYYAEKYSMFTCTDTKRTCNFLFNDHFIVDEIALLCAVILDKTREFTDQGCYTTSDLREYQKIFLKNPNGWINKFISHLNIYRAPQQIPVQRSMIAVS